MKKQMITCLAVMCMLMLICSAHVGTAWAYFTTYAEAQGGYTIELGEQTEIYEDFSAWTKHIVVTADEGSKPVYVRAIAFCGSEYTLNYEDGSGLWTQGADGYYYYNDILDGGQSTQELLIRIENVPTDMTDTASFNVVVIYESTPVCYDENGSAYADWTAVLENSTGEGGVGA